VKVVPGAARDARQHGLGEGEACALPRAVPAEQPPEAGGRLPELGEAGVLRLPPRPAHPADPSDEDVPPQLLPVPGQGIEPDATAVAEDDEAAVGARTRDEAVAAGDTDVDVVGAVHDRHEHLEGVVLPGHHEHGVARADLVGREIVELQLHAATMTQLPPVGAHERVSAPIRRRRRRS